MGNSASKAARKLPRQVPTQAKTALKIEPTRVNEPSARANTENLRPDGHDPDDLLSRLSRIGPVQLAEEQNKYQPAKSDVLIQTLEYRAQVQAADAEASTHSGVKTLLPVQTVTAILQSLQAGDSKESIARSYNTTTETIDKLNGLTVPRMTVGRRQ